jgi:glycosyltransferase involved in cell wall biosynthesis
VRHLLDYPQYRQKLGENALKLAQNRYSWSAIAQELAQAYRDLIMEIE